MQRCIPKQDWRRRKLQKRELGYDEEDSASEPRCLGSDEDVRCEVLSCNELQVIHNINRHRREQIYRSVGIFLWPDCIIRNYVDHRSGFGDAPQRSRLLMVTSCSIAMWSCLFKNVQSLIERSKLGP